MTPKEAKTRLLLKCLFMSEFAGKEEAEMEDLFPEKLYLDAVKEAYPDIETPLEFTEDEKKIQCVAKRVKAAFERMANRTFEKWRPSKVVLDWTQENPEIVPRETLTKFELIFKDVNRILR